MPRTWALLCAAGLCAGAAVDTPAAPKVRRDTALPRAHIRTQHARTAPLEIRGGRLAAGSVPRHGRAELSVDVSATYDNPFDSSDVIVEARLTAPSGRTHRVPGFLDLAPGAGSELGPASARWLVRFSPAETGAYRVTLLARDRNGAAAAPGPRLTVTPSPAPAPVRAGTRGFFERDGGGVFFPLGVELNAGKPDPSARLAAAARLGANAVLLPLPTAGRPGVLEEEDPRQGLAVDRVLEAAASRGIAVVLSLEAAAPAVDAWSGSAWNRENGGPLDEAREFWTHPTAAAIYRDRLRYAVARYGGSPAVLGWELRGEPDTAGDADVVRGWFQGMVEELKRVDPHARPVGVAPAGLAPAGADWTRDRSPGAGGQARAGSRPHVVAAGEAEGAVWKAIGGGSAGLFVPAGRESLLSAARDFVAGLPAAGDLALAYAEQGGPLALAGLAPGAWSAELWEPASGRRVGRMPVTVKPDGTARVDLAGRGPVVLRLRRGAGERGPGVR